MSATAVAAWVRPVAPKISFAFSPMIFGASSRINSSRPLISGITTFDNVERTAGAVIGEQPVRYVSNIAKYYLAYKLVEQQRAQRDEAMDAAGRGSR